MKVFKFGGASVRNADAIRNVARIIKAQGKTDLLVVVSAINKTTNALEELVNLSRKGMNFDRELNEILDFHLTIFDDLFPSGNVVRDKIESYRSGLTIQLQAADEFDQMYDNVVSTGELISSMLLTAYLQEVDIDSTWIDARDYVRTDNTFREGKVDWTTTQSLIGKLTPSFAHSILVTQGFIGRSHDGYTTTLGREGSDFTAAIFGSCLRAESVTIWKDVPGVMSADPKRLPDASTFEELPFREAAEMTYYGASVIHPKTIKPLATHSIPLLVKNFDDITLPGTRIHECHVEKLPPLIVFKENQCLISCHVTDYTFIDESQIGVIFSALASRSLKVNMMQNSAISFSFCLDFKGEKVMELISELSKSFEVYYNTGLTLITVKNYDAKTFSLYRNEKEVILEQSSRSTLQVLVRS